tara:strand:- start:50 stop:289 length:240 start_codon:yes stop_codon:yes gene_type:complete
MDSIPKDTLKILQDRELSLDQRLVAYAMFVPNLPVSPAHASACAENIKLGHIIKDLIDQGTLKIQGMRGDKGATLIIKE